MTNPCSAVHKWASVSSRQAGPDTLLSSTTMIQSCGKNCKQEGQVPGNTRPTWVSLFTAQEETWGSWGKGTVRIGAAHTDLGPNTSELTVPGLFRSSWWGLDHLILTWWPCTFLSVTEKAKINKWIGKYINKYMFGWGQRWQTGVSATSFPLDLKDAYLMSACQRLLVNTKTAIWLLLAPFFL